MRKPVLINPIVADLPDVVPFVAPEALARASGVEIRARLGANEGNFGPSPAAIDAMKRAARDDSWKYCDPECAHLRGALAAHLQTDEQNIIIGPGIDGLLGLIVRIFSDLGDAIVTSLGAYPTFNYHVNGYGRRLVTARYRDDREDLAALAQAVHDNNARMVYLANPDNPMGTWWEADDIAAFIDNIGDDVLIVLDEAYGELAPAGTLLPIDVSRPNLIRLRTFSKAYGLAGLRVGYAIGHLALTKPFHRVRDHFGVNIMAQKAALASLADQNYLIDTTTKIAKGRARIAAIGARNALGAIASATNFVALDCGADGAFADRVLAQLAAQGVFIRKPNVPILNRCIRVSVGRDEELDIFEQALPLALAHAQELIDG